MRLKYFCCCFELSFEAKKKFYDYYLKESLLVPVEPCQKRCKKQSWHFTCKSRITNFKYMVRNTINSNKYIVWYCGNYALFWFDDLHCVFVRWNIFNNFQFTERLCRRKMAKSRPLYQLTTPTAERIRAQKSFTQF